MSAELSPVRVEDNLILSGEAAPYAIVLIGIRTRKKQKKILRVEDNLILSREATLYAIVLIAIRTVCVCVCVCVCKWKTKKIKKRN